jgi:hypothetical protein
VETQKTTVEYANQRLMEAADEIRFGPQWSVVLITPELAAFIISICCGTMQRKRSKGWVEAYARDIRSGDWIGESGQPISFGEDGSLINGQHRLAAIALAGMDVQQEVRCGVTVRAFPVTDEHYKRGSEIASRDLDVSRPADSWAVARWCHRYDTYLSKTGPTNAMDHAVTNSMARTILRFNPGIETSVCFVAQYRKRLTGLIPPATAMFVHFVGAKTSPDKADQFIIDIAMGENLTSDMPVYCLRRRLSAMPRVGHVARNAVLALSIKAWRSFEIGNQMKVLSWRPPETFPCFACDEPLLPAYTPLAPPA